MQTGMNHAIHRHSHTKRQNGRIIKFMDKSAYLMGVITVAVNLPQLFSVWLSPDIRGVSLISWVGFLLGSFFWLLYGIIHGQKPIVIINGSLIIVQGLIVAGIFNRAGLM